MLLTETNLLTRIKTRTKNPKFLVIGAKVCNLIYRPAPLNLKFQLLQFITIPFILPISIAQTLLIWDFLAKLGPSYNYPFLLILLIRPYLNKKVYSKNVICIISNLATFYKIF